MSFAPITEEKRAACIDWLRNICIDEFQCEAVEDGHVYEFDSGTETGTDVYCAFLTADELTQILSLALDIMEELKEINNSGKDGDWLFRTLEEAVEKRRNKSQSDIVFVLIAKDVFTALKTERLKELIGRVYKVRRVDGTYALLISNPALFGGICKVFHQIVDAFDDEEQYNLSALLMLKVLFLVHSEKIEQST